MLVLTRKQGETILIGDDIKITVVAVNGDAVRIGIEAPKHIKILRAELVEAVSQINQLAAVSRESGGSLARPVSPGELLQVQKKRDASS